MLIYAWQGDLYCEACGEDIISRLESRVEHDGDSDTYPQANYQSGGESDSPNHCGSHEHCLCAEHLVGMDRPIGAFLQNPLTTEGKAYVLAAHEECPSPVTELWLEHYFNGCVPISHTEQLWRTFFNDGEEPEESTDNE